MAALAPPEISKSLLAAGLIFSACSLVLKHYREGNRPRSYVLAKNAPLPVQEILEKCSALAHMKQRMFLGSLENFSISNPDTSKAFFENHLLRCFEPQHLSNTLEALRKLVELLLQASQDATCPASRDFDLQAIMRNSLQLLNVSKPS